MGMLGSLIRSEKARGTVRGEECDIVWMDEGWWWVVLIFDTVLINNSCLTGLLYIVGIEIDHRCENFCMTLSSIDLVVSAMMSCEIDVFPSSSHFLAERDFCIVKVVR